MSETENPQKTPEELNTNAEQPDAAMLIGAAQSLWNGSDARVTVEIRVAEKLRDAMAGYGIAPLERVFLADSDIRHIMNHHTQNEQRRGQIDLTPDDFGVLPLVLNDFDSCTHTDTDKMGNKKSELVKSMHDEYYVVTIQRGKRKLQVKTMWTKPGASC